MSASTVPTDEAGTGESPAAPGRGTGSLPGVRLVARRLWWVALATALGLTVGLLVAGQRPAQYESTALVSVTSTTPQPVTDIVAVAQALARVTTAPGLVSAPLRQAGYRDAAADPQRYVGVQAAPNAPLVSVSGLATDPEDAQAVAEVVLSAVAGVEAFEGFDVLVVAPPPLPAVPTRPAWVLPAGLAVLSGALALIAAAAVPGRSRRER